MEHETAEYPNRVLCSKGLILTRSLAEYDELINDIASEAIKEFWDEVKKQSFQGCDCATNADVVFVSDGDDVLEEMVGEGE